jgi:hypothetical protein
MLEFYWLLDDEEMPEYPNQDRYMGELDYGQAKALKCVWEQCSTPAHPNRGEIYFAHSDDFVLRSHEIKILLEYCQDCLDKVDPQDRKTVKHYTDFIKLLEQAIQEEHRGLAAYVD